MRPHIQYGAGFELVEERQGRTLLRVNGKVLDTLSEYENVYEGSGEDAEGDEGVGPHEGDSHTGKVVRGDHAVLVGDHTGGDDAADVVGDGEIEKDADRQQAADGEYVEGWAIRKDAGMPNRRETEWRPRSA